MKGAQIAGAPTMPEGASGAAPVMAQPAAPARPATPPVLTRPAAAPNRARRSADTGCRSTDRVDAAGTAGNRGPDPRRAGG